MATTVVDSPRTGGKVDEKSFLDLARAYSLDRKGVDWLSSQPNPDDAIARVMKVIQRLQHTIADGSDYTPSAHLGFGSANASTIASGILGAGLTGSQIRKLFAGIGKPAK
jgi:hypothetical protein